MERIVTLAVYKNRKDPQVCVEFVKNYRSHPKILEFSSKCFYDSRLSAMADIKNVDSLCSWKRLRNKNFPLLFCR
jgi:superfamily I DNA and/or RNA helicase